MEENTKKIVLIVVVVLCLAAAGAITYWTMGGSSSSTVTAAGMTWLKCNNPNCGYEYETSIQEYNKVALAKGASYAARYGPIPIKCPKCSEESVFKAIKCEKCGKVFFPGAVEGPFDDKCPACGYSKKEDDSKKQAAEKK